MKKGNTLYIEGNFTLSGYYNLFGGSKDLFKLEKLDGDYLGVPNHRGKIVVPEGDSSVENRNCAIIILHKKKSLTGLLFKSPACAGFPERYFLELRNGSSRKK